MKRVWLVSRIAATVARTATGATAALCRDGEVWTPGETLQSRLRRAILAVDTQVGGAKSVLTRVHPTRVRPTDRPAL